jgi:hypothetical protein
LAQDATNHQKTRYIHKNSTRMSSDGWPSLDQAILQPCRKKKNIKSSSEFNSKDGIEAKFNKIR